MRVYHGGLHRADGGGSTGRRAAGPDAISDTVDSLAGEDVDPVYESAGPR